MIFMKINRKTHSNAISAFGRVDTGNEICLNAVATGFDAVNNRVIGVSVSERLRVLKMLCRDVAPNKVSIVNNIINIVDRFYSGNISKSKAMGLLNSIHNKIIGDMDVFNIAIFNNSENVFNPFQVENNVFGGF